MRLHRCLALPLLLVLCTFFAGPSSGAADELSDARAEFARAAGSGSLDERQAALERLIALSDPAFVADFEAEFARVSTGVRTARDEVYRRRYRLERQEALLATMKLRLARDESLAEPVRKQEEQLAELRGSLAKEERKLGDLEPWFDALSDGASRFFAALPDAKRKKAEAEIWKEVEEAPELARQLAAIELLGACGGEGTAVDLQKRIEGYCTERTKLERELPKLMVELRKLEGRWQKEQDQSGGRHSPATEEQYSRAKKGAAEAQRAISMYGYLADACAEAGGKALSREESALLEKSLQKLLRAQAKAGDGARQRSLRLIGYATDERARAALRELLDTETDAGPRAAILDVLAEAGDAAFQERLLGPLLTDEAWLVRSRTASALARLRVRAAIPVLIERLAVEDGRLRSDVRGALISLTGQDFRNNVELWRRWWQENEATFEVPPIAQIEERASEEAKDSVGVTFFGIETDSRRVLFVLDLSRSMTFSMVPRNSPNDEDPNNPDMPREGELSRLEEAKRALTKALGGIEDGSRFNIVFYATDVWPWQDQPIEMDSKTRSEAMRYVEALEANGGTNIYGALVAALDMAGAKGGDEWSQPEIDTIYFLSDGRPSVGVTTDPEEILAFVRDRNASAGITIHTIGLSGAQDAFLMRSLAEQNGGTYVAR